MSAHRLAVGDELYDKTDARFRITEVHDDGGVALEIDDGNGFHRSAAWSEEEITTALSEGLLRTKDGRSDELVEA